MERLSWRGIWSQKIDAVSCRLRGTIHPSGHDFRHVHTIRIGPPGATRLATGRFVIAWLRLFLPGMALCVAVTAVAKLMEAGEVSLTGHLYLEGLVIAILIGVAIRTVWKPGPAW